MYKAKAPNPETHYTGKVCAKHPECNGLRKKANRICYRCDMEAQERRRERFRAARGPLIPVEPKDWAEIGFRRRLSPAYNARMLELKHQWRARKKAARDGLAEPA